MVDDVTNTLPASISATEGTSTPISGLAINDPDLGSNVTTVTLAVQHGTLTVLTNVAGGLTAGEVAGNGGASVTLTGTQAQINATLAAASGVSYLEQGDNASDTLPVATADQGTGFTKIDTAPITVTLVDDVTNTLPASIADCYTSHPSP